MDRQRELRLQDERLHHRAVTEDLQSQVRVLREQLGEMSGELEAKRREVKRHEELALKYGESVQEWEY